MEETTKKEFIIELAKSNRSLCKNKQCGLYINKNELRFGKKYLMKNKNHTGILWYHLDCIKAFRSEIKTLDSIDGIDSLPLFEKKNVELWFIGKEIKFQPQQTLGVKCDFCDKNEAIKEMAIVYSEACCYGCNYSYTKVMDKTKRKICHDKDCNKKMKKKFESMSVEDDYRSECNLCGKRIYGGLELKMV